MKIKFFRKRYKYKFNNKPFVDYGLMNHDTSALGSFEGEYISYVN